MHKILEVLKKHWVPIAAIGGGILVWIYLRNSQSSSTAAPQTLAQGVTPQYYTQPSSGGGVAPSGSTGVDVSPTASVTQPSTSASGVPSSSPSIVPYISPSNVVSTPGSDTQLSATNNPYANQPNVNMGSDPFGIAPNIPASAIAAYNGPTKPGTSIISAIQAILTGKPSATPGGGATTADPALAAALSASQLPGGLAMLPSANPNLTSTAYTDLQRSQINGPGCCQVDSMGNGGPNSPCCQVSQATGENVTGAPTAASKVYQASVYCEGNHFNAGFFGTAADTTNCSGPTANGNLIGDLIGQYIPSPSTQTSLPSQGIGNLPPNWNSLTRDQQNAWASTGIVPSATQAPTTPTGNNNTALAGFIGNGNNFNQLPGVALTPGHPGTNSPIPGQQKTTQFPVSFPALPNTGAPDASQDPFNLFNPPIQSPYPVQ